MKTFLLAALALSALSVTVQAAPALNERAAVAPVTVTLGTESAPVGAEFTVPVTVGDLGGQAVLAYRIVVTYDPAVVTALEPSTSGTLTSSGWSTVSNDETVGELVISAASATGLSASGTLIDLRFEAVAVGASALEFSEATFNEGDPEADPQDGEATVTASTSVTAGPNALGFRIRAPYPNPSSGSVVVEIQSDRDDEATVRVTDVTGRTVLDARPVRLAPGGASVVRLETAGLPAGSYFAVVSTSGGKESVRLVVTR